MTRPTRKLVPSTPGAPNRGRPVLVRVLKWTLVSLGTVVVISSSLLLIASHGFATESNSDAPLDNAEMMRFRFQDRSFAIPKSYQPSRFVIGEGETFSFLVWAVLPDFGPDKTSRNQDSLIAGKGQPSVQIIVTVAPINMPPDDLVRRKIEPIISGSQPGPAGLRRYDIGNGALPMQPAAYVPEQPDDAIYIGCYIVNGTPKLCTMEAIYEHAALMEVVFDGHFLADWQEIVSGARRLVKSFEVQPQ
jgi:hypothetical protein